MYEICRQNGRDFEEVYMYAKKVEVVQEKSALVDIDTQTQYAIAQSVKLAQDRAAAEKKSQNDFNMF